MLSGKKLDKKYMLLVNTSVKQIGKGLQVTKILCQTMYGTGNHKRVRLQSCNRLV